MAGPARRPASPVSTTPLETQGSQMGLQCGKKDASSKEQMELLTTADREVCGSNPCPPTPCWPPGSVPRPGTATSCPACQPQAPGRLRGRPLLPLPPASLLLACTPSLSRSRICPSDTLTTLGDGWRVWGAPALRQRPQQPGNFPGSASEPLRPHEGEASMLCHHYHIVLARRKTGSSRWQV